MNKSKGQKLASAAVLFFFLASGSIYPQQASPVTEPVSKVGDVDTSSVRVNRVDGSPTFIQADLNPYNVTIPEEFGNVEEVFQGRVNSPLIVHIQNVHANYEAQVNIKQILKHLVERFGFALIQLEGAVSKLDPAILEPSYLEEVNLKLVDMLMRQGRITGADAFAVETDKPVELYGIEDYSLYMENLKMFKTIYRHQAEVGGYFSDVHRMIQDTAPKLFSPELLDFIRKTEEFSGNRIDLLDYLLYLNKLSEKHQLASLNDLKEMARYPNLVRIMRLHKLEEELNKSGLKKETEALKQEFRQKLPASKELDDVLARLDENAKGVTPRKYFLELTKLADEAKIDFINYPAFRIYAEFLIHQDEIDHRGLFSELKDFEEFLQEKLFLKEDEKLFLDVIDFIGLLEQYFRLEMSREKIALYLKDRQKITPSWIASQLEALAQTYGVHAKESADVQALDSYMDELEYYYQLVLARDEAFIEKIISRMKSQGQDKTILVTGGFHKDGLIDHFRKEAISYVIINPKVDVKEGNENYLKVMLEDEAVVGSVFAGTFALEILDFIAPRLREDKEFIETMKIYGASTAPNFVFDKERKGDIKGIIKATNEALGRVADNSRVLGQVEGPPEFVGSFIRVNFKAAILDNRGLPQQWVPFRVDFNKDTGDVTVTPLLPSGLRPAELRRFGIGPQRPVSSEPINRAELGDLARTLRVPRFPLRAEGRTRDVRNLFSESLIMEKFIPRKELPSNLIGAVPDKLLRAEVRKKLAALENVTPDSVATILRESSLPVVDLGTAVDRAVEEDRLSMDQSNRLGAFAKRSQPSILVAYAEDETSIVSILNSFAESFLFDRETPIAAVIYGSKIEAYAMVRLGELGDDIRKRIIIVDERKTEEQVFESILAEIKNGANIHKLWNLFFAKRLGAKTPYTIAQEGYVRPLIPKRAAALVDQIVSFAPDIPLLELPTVPRGDREAIEASHSVGIQTARVLPRPKKLDEMEKFRALLKELGLVGIIEQMQQVPGAPGSGVFGFAAGWRAAILEFYQQRQADLRIAVAA